MTEHMLRDVLGITTCEDMLKNSALLCALLSDLSSGQYDNPPTLTPFFLFPLTKSPPLHWMTGNRRPFSCKICLNLDFAQNVSCTKGC